MMDPPAGVAADMPSLAEGIPALSLLRPCV